MDHRAILRALDLLHGVAPHVSHNDIEAQCDAKTLIGFFKEFADRCHDTKEEMILFPRLMSAGMQVEGGPISVMLHEHDQGRSLLQDMSDALEKGDWIGFELYAERYIYLLARHIDREEHIFFKIVESLLSEHDDEEVAKAFEAMEERMGFEGHQALHRTMRAIEAKYLVAGVT
jgi:hemerythrin-like domain-containing protein